jgi:hypothetical protein
MEQRTFGNIFDYYTGQQEIVQFWHGIRVTYLGIWWWQKYFPIRRWETLLVDTIGIHEKDNIRRQNIMKVKNWVQNTVNPNDYTMHAGVSETPNPDCERLFLISFRNKSDIMLFRLIWG